MTTTSTPANDMTYVNLGQTGLKVSRICLGTMSFGSKKWQDWVLTEEDSIPIIKRALDLGINFFDTADIYSNGVSEQILGNAIKKYANREDVVIATKVFFPDRSQTPVFGNTFPNRKGLSRKHIFASVEQSLKNLQMDYIDLYQIHRFDPETPVEETMGALHDLVKAGKIRYIGASSMYAHQFAQMQYAAEKNNFTKFVSMQNLYNMLYREEEREMIPTCKLHGVGLIPWSPLATGLLTDRETSSTNRDKISTLPANQWFLGEDGSKEVLARAKEIAKKKGVPTSQLALAWLLQKRQVVSPIIGPTKMTHLEDAVAALKVKLTDEEMAYVEEKYPAKPTYGWLSASN